MMYLSYFITMFINFTIAGLWETVLVIVVQHWVVLLITTFFSSEIICIAEF